MGRAVLLEHTLPNGSRHYDWLIERSADSVLLSFRVSVRIDVDPPPPGSGFEAEAMPDHRLEYLTFEGEVSGGRGQVKRVAEGEMDVTERPGEVRIEGRLGNVWGRFDGKCVDGNRWWFSCETW